MFTTTTNWMSLNMCTNQHKPNSIEKSKGKSFSFCLCYLCRICIVCFFLFSILCVYVFTCLPSRILEKYLKYLQWNEIQLSVNNISKQCLELKLLPSETCRFFPQLFFFLYVLYTCSTCSGVARIFLRGGLLTLFFFFVSLGYNIFRNIHLHERRGYAYLLHFGQQDQYILIGYKGRFTP